MIKLDKTRRRKQKAREAAARVYGLNRCETCDQPTSLPLNEDGICTECRRRFQEELDAAKMQEIADKRRERYKRLLAEKQRREALKREKLYKGIEGSWS